MGVRKRRYKSKYGKGRNIASFIYSYYNQEVSKGARKEWDSVDVELTVKDDLGNIYSGEGNGEVANDPYNIHWSATSKNQTKMQQSLSLHLVCTCEYIHLKIMVE